MASLLPVQRDSDDQVCRGMQELLSTMPLDEVLSLVKTTTSGLIVATTLPGTFGHALALKV